MSQNSQETEPDEGSKSCREYVEFANDNNCPEKRFKNKSPEKTSSIKKPFWNISRDSPIEQNAAEEKPYDQFGKFVAAELCQLPQQQAILLQQEIQNCIIRSKLSYLEHMIYSNPQVDDVAFSPSSGHSLA